MIEFQCEVGFQLSSGKKARCRRHRTTWSLGVRAIPENEMARIL